MAHGYPDYWKQAGIALPILAIGQTFWWDSNSENVAGPGQADIIAGGPLAGQTLYIVGGAVSINFPVMARYTLTINGVASGQITFDTEALLPFNPSAFVMLEPLQGYSLMIHNDDNLAHICSAIVFGFTVAVVPGVPAPVGLGLPQWDAGV